MTKIFIVAMTLLSLGSSAQTTDSAAIQVSYQQKAADKNFALIINGELIPHFDIATLDINVLGTFNVKKTDTVINGHTYSASILITTKDGYVPDYITLNDLKRKHTDVKAGPVIFMIDNRIISNDYEKITVDEKYIQKIAISTIQNPEENVDVNLIRITLGKKENAKKSEDFMIRGTSPVEPAADYFESGVGAERQKATKGKGRML